MSDLRFLTLSVTATVPGRKPFVFVTILYIYISFYLKKKVDCSGEGGGGGGRRGAICFLWELLTYNKDLSLSL